MPAPYINTAMDEIKETERSLSQHLLSIIGLEKKIFYGCIALAATIVWLVLFTEEPIIAKPLLIVFLSIISFTWLMTILAIILNLSMYNREVEQRPPSTGASRALVTVRATYIIGLVASIVLAIIFYSLNV